MHYKIIMNEYVFLNNCNVFIEEDKHRYLFHFYFFILLMFTVYRWFKLKIYIINFFNIKCLFLKHKNMQQRLWFLLLNIFIMLKLSFTDIFQQLYSECFNLFNDILFKLKQQNKNLNYLLIMSDAAHQQSAIIIHLQLKYCNTVFNLSIWVFIMLNTFWKNLQETYLNYNMSEIVYFKISNIKWCKKLNFNNL